MKKNIKNNSVYTPLKEGYSDKIHESSLINKDEEYEHGKHPNSLKALEKHQFQKGVSGNALGRKPNYAKLGEQLKELADKETFDWSDKSLGTRKAQVLDKIWDDAIRGDMKKIQLLATLGCLD